MVGIGQIIALSPFNHPPYDSDAVFGESEGIDRRPGKAAAGRVD